MDIRELVADSEIAGAYPLMRQLRDRLREETFLAEVRRQQVEGYAKLGFQFLTSIPCWAEAGDLERG